MKLQTNNVMVSIEGTGSITFGKLGEKYMLSRRVPDTKVEREGGRDGERGRRERGRE